MFQPLSSSRKFLRSRRGFTLLEVLVAIAAMILLAVLIFPAFQSVRMRAGLAHEINALRNIAVSTATYAADHDGVMPPATPFGQHHSHRVLPFRIMMEQGYLDPRDLYSPLARKWSDPVASGGWFCAGTNRNSGRVEFNTRSFFLGNPNYTNVHLIAFESWANPAYHSRPSTPWAGQTDTPTYPVPPAHRLGIEYQWPGHPDPLPPSRMKMAWNFEYDIAAGQAGGVQYWRKGPGVCLFADGHVEVTNSKDQASWFEYMTTR